MPVRRHQLLAALLLLPAPALAQAPEPPLWVVSDADSTIYLMGTVHVLPDGAEWRGAAFEDAMAEVDEVWLEIADLNPPPNFFALISEYGMSPNERLSEKLDPETVEGLAAILDQHGIPLESFEGLEPWFAYMQLAGLMVVEAGFDPLGGIDMAIRDEALARGIPVKGFETFESQFQVLAEMDQSVQIAVLEQTIAEYDEALSELEVQLQSWISGDLSDLDVLNAEIAGEMPAFYQALFADRNRRFVEGVARIMEGEGTALVAVGLGHYTGPEDIIELLEEAGFAVERR